MTEEIEISVQIGAVSHCTGPCSSGSAGILVGEERRGAPTEGGGVPRNGRSPSNSLLTSADDDDDNKVRAAKSGSKRTTTAKGDERTTQNPNGADNAADMAFYLSDSSTSCCSSASSACPSSASCHPPDAEGAEKRPQKVCHTPATCSKSIAETEETLWRPTEKPDAKLKVRTLGLMAAILPAVGCYFCLAYTFAFQFDRVANFTIPSSFCPGLKSMFPPVSYSIGVWKPQKYIWLMVLTVHIPPRFFYSIVHKCHYAMGDSEFRQRRWFSKIRRLHFFLLVVEALGLLAVSVIDIEKVHAICFALWLIPHCRVFRIKCALFLLGYPISVSTAISYATFLLRCSTFAYATFSLAEYFLIGINSIFYFLIVWEFEGSKLEVYVKHSQHRLPTTEAEK
ncbi:hypothetical protein niasHT_000658 [Heterodera trifolii]|uniref:CWH43-like N-terminal domain-containing protein n=1 Tax=Heterodera trifolii TaxID=157864 RepID=A0ABD2MCL5_9BILA